MQPCNNTLLRFCLLRPTATMWDAEGKIEVVCRYMVATDRVSAKSTVAGLLVSVSIHSVYNACMLTAAYRCIF